MLSEWWAQPWVWRSGEGEKDKEGFLVKVGLVKQWNLSPKSGPHPELILA